MPRSSIPKTAPRKTRTRKAATPQAGIEAALQALREEVAALRRDVMHLPHADDYEPLVSPLREFTRVSPVLAETLAAVVKAVTPLPAMLQPLFASVDAPARAALADAVERMAAARGAIREALATLPRDRSYASAAAHLRELATVSPSLMEWMRQLPALSLPLGESVAALEQAARELEEAERGARRVLEGNRAGRETP